MKNRISYLIIAALTILIIMAVPGQTQAAQTVVSAYATDNRHIYIMFSSAANPWAGTVTVTRVSDNASVAVSGSALLADNKTLSITTGADLTPTEKYRVDLANVNPGPVSLPNNFIYALSPHGFYDPASGNVDYTIADLTQVNPNDKCKTCHYMHNTPNSKLLTEAQQYTLCFNCHGAGGPAQRSVYYPVSAEFNRGGSYHKAAPPSTDPTPLKCSDCHNPHGDKSGNGLYSRLLRTWDDNGSPGYTYQGNDYCFGCHGAVDKGLVTSKPYISGDSNYWSGTGNGANIYLYTGGNHRNSSAIHYDTSYGGGYFLPSSNTQITCIKCHEPHGSQWNRLLDNNVSANGSEEGLCFKCHGSDDITYNMDQTNIYRQFYGPTISVGTPGAGVLPAATYYLKATAVLKPAATAPAAPTLNISGTGITATVYVRYTVVYQTSDGNYTWEGYPSQWASLALANQGVQVVMPATATFPGFKEYRVYAGTVKGAESFQGATTGTTFTITNLINTGGAPPRSESVPGPEVSKTIAANQTLPITISGVDTAKVEGFKVYIGTASNKEYFQAYYPASQSWPVSYNTALGTHGFILSAPADNSDAKHTIDAAGGSKVECSSCHDPHTVDNNRFSQQNAQTTSTLSDPTNTKKFYVYNQTYDNSFSDRTQGPQARFCISCHNSSFPGASISSTILTPFGIAFPATAFTTNNGYDKSGYTSSGHFSNATVDIQCDRCHDSHGTPYARMTLLGEDMYTLTGTKNAAGICLQCHGNLTGTPGATVARLNVFTDLTRNTGIDKRYSHPTLEVSGVHKDTETYQNQGTANRHAECYDCHDPHAATNTASTTGTGNASGAIANVLGVTPSYATATTNWSAPGSAEYTTGLITANSSKEYQLCFKCHSGYYYNGATPTPPGSVQESDLARDFNPNNYSYHIVGIPGQVASSYTAWKGTWTAGSNMTPSTVLNCTSCHGPATSDSYLTADSNTPHGSSNAYILRGVWTSTTTSSTANNLCLKCHNQANGQPSRFQTSSGGSNLHFSRSEHNIACQYCHGVQPHGAPRPGLLAIMSTSTITGNYAYRADYDGIYGTGSRLYLKNWRSNAGYWRQSDCGCNGSGH